MFSSRDRTRTVVVFPQPDGPVSSKTPPCRSQNPNLQFHSRLRGRFNDPGLRRKVVFVICYHHGIMSPPRVSIKCCYQIIRPFSQHFQGPWSVPHFQASEAILTEFGTHNPISIRIKPPSNKLEIIQWKASLLTVHWQPCGEGAPRNLELILTELVPKAEGKKNNNTWAWRDDLLGFW